jgi:hypothetical protein
MPTIPHTPFDDWDPVGRCAVCGGPGALLTIQDRWLGAHY